MPDTKSEEYRKMRDERRELVQLVVEEAVEKTGQLPTAADVARELGFGDSKAVRLDWDWLHAQGKLPQRPWKPLPARLAGKNFGTEGGGSLLEAEGLLRTAIAEIANATPQYRAMAQKFWVTHLDNIARLTEEALGLALGATVDDLIGQITRKEER